MRTQKLPDFRHVGARETPFVYFQLWKEVFSMTKNDEREVQRKLRVLQHAERTGRSCQSNCT
jgi:ferritin